MALFSVYRPWSTAVTCNKKETTAWCLCTPPGNLETLSEKISCQMLVCFEGMASHAEFCGVLYADHVRLRHLYNIERLPVLLYLILSMSSRCFGGPHHLALNIPLEIDLWRTQNPSYNIMETITCGGVFSAWWDIYSPSSCFHLWVCLPAYCSCASVWYMPNSIRNSRYLIQFLRNISLCYHTFATFHARVQYTP